MKSSALKHAKPVFIFTLIALSLALIGCSYVTGAAVTLPAPQPVITNVSPVQASDLIRANSGNTRFVILDVRTPAEYADGHLAGAINLDVNSGTFQEEVSKLDMNRTYLVYCSSGVRSAAASKIMSELGFRYIYNMTGGITAWKSAGLPVVK
jgi:rhodanese-related sulfurtransferase